MELYGCLHQRRRLYLRYLTADLLGHDGGTPDYGSSVAPTLFVLDKTNPTITISFDNNSVANGKYYNAHRTATVLVHEHNFSSEGARVTATAQILEGTVDTPVAGTWRTVGDDNKVDVPFNEDGNYTLHAAYGSCRKCGGRKIG